MIDSGNTQDKDEKEFPFDGSFGILLHQNRNLNWRLSEKAAFPSKQPHGGCWCVGSHPLPKTKLWPYKWYYFMDFKWKTGRFYLINCLISLHQSRMFRRTLRKFHFFPICSLFFFFSCDTIFFFFLLALWHKKGMCNILFISGIITYFHKNKAE